MSFNQKPLALARLLQLASPALPVGAYSYSQGLEAAIEAAIVKDASSAQHWIEDVLELSVASLEAPVLLRLCLAWRDSDEPRARHWNDLFLASRESAELRAETLQMGYSLVQLLTELGEAHPFQSWDEVAFPTAFAYCAMRFGIEPRDALIAYLWAWAENQVIAALKAIPLGQSAGQRVLLALGPRLVEQADRAAALPDNDLGNMAPGLALLSSNHETQYSRLFRS
ncbi:MAG TPA: urease accessory protein UreF [Burkholderiales bacterium]|nr:urease accessory protein UreF [Burkholderiales bacterium]